LYIATNGEQMKIHVLEKNDSELSFKIEGISAAYANTLRRIMMSEVPTMAVEFVDFTKNGSVVNDELLSNRLGQIPLKFDKRAYNLLDACTCEGKGCSKCQVSLVLKKKGPCVVYSGDLKTSSKDVVPVYDKIPIAELFEGQELEFEAIAQLGEGRKHAKWQAAVVGYKNVPDITINIKNPKEFDRFIKICPKHVIRIERDKLVAAAPLDCTLCMQCVEEAGEEGIKVVPIEDQYVFNVESVCGRDADDIVITAADVLEERIKDFSKALGKLK